MRRLAVTGHEQGPIAGMSKSTVPLRVRGTQMEHVRADAEPTTFAADFGRVAATDARGRRTSRSAASMTGNRPEMNSTSDTPYLTSS